MRNKKRAAPQKECPDCGCNSHARVSDCKECGYAFYQKKRSIEKELELNWRDLKEGDIIKCVKGNGPYWIEKSTGDKNRGFAHKGRYEVVDVYDEGEESCGIVARQLIGRSNRVMIPLEYIYMGKSH